jgi:hypothetical protein
MCEHTKTQDFGTPVETCWPKHTGNLTGTAFGAYIRKVNVFGPIREMETSIKFWLKKKQQKQLTEPTPDVSYSAQVFHDE